MSRAAKASSPARERGDLAKILVMVGVAVLTSGVQGIAIPLISRFPEYLEADAVDTAWILTGTLLIGVISTPIAGRLADLVGKRRVLVAQLAIVLAGSLLVAFEQGLWWAIVGRGMQGVALGMVPVGLGILRDSVRPQNLTRGIVLVSAGLGLGGAIGHVVAAVVAVLSDWRWIFAGTAILVAVSLLSVLWLLPTGPRSASTRFDVAGALLLAVALTGSLLVLSKFTVWGWSPLVMALAAASSVSFIAFVIVESRVRAPLINLRVVRSRSIALTDVAACGIGFASFVGFGSLPQLMQAPSGTEVGLGVSLFESALILSLVGIVMLTMTPLTRVLIERFGAQPVLVLGCLVFVLAMGFALFFIDGVWQVITIVCLSGAGLGFASSAMPAIIMSAAPTDETAAANGLMTVLQSLGSAVAAALAGAIVGGSAVIVDGVAAPTRLAYTELFAIGVGAVVIALIASIAIGRERATQEPPAPGIVVGGGLVPSTTEEHISHEPDVDPETDKKGVFT